MAQVKHDFWEGCDVRQLLPLEELTNCDRLSFWAICNTQMKETMESAEKLGIDPDHARIRWIRKMSDKNLFYYCVIILGMDFINHDFGYRLCWDVQKNKWEKLWVIAREHYKSTIITCASTLWEICKDPNRTYCIYSYKQDMAKVFLGQIKQWIKDRQILRLIWPDVFWADPERGYEDNPDGTRTTWTWNSAAIEVKRSKKQKEMTIETGGIQGSSKTGGHFSHQIFDDCETPNNVQTPEAIETLYNAISMAMNTGQTENLNTCFIGTFYAKADAYTRMIKDHLVDQAIIQSCYDEKGNSICYSAEALEKKRKKIGSISGWATQMLCDPSLSAQNTFNEEWIQYWSANNRANLNIYTFVDPSSGKTSKKHDFTVMWTVGFNSLGQMMILDLRRDKMNFKQKWESLIDIKKTYNPLMFYYEEVGMQSDIESLQREMDLNNVFFPITKYSPIGKGDKASRIEKVVFKVSQHEVWFPEFCYHPNFQGEIVDMMGEFIREEIYGYPNTPHDDGLDCLSQAVLMLNEKQIVLPDTAFGMDSLDSKKDEYEEDDYDPFMYAVYGN